MSGIRPINRALQEEEMKEVTIKKGSRTIIKFVPDDWEEDNSIQQSDLTTSSRKSIGFSDIDKNKWDKIFNH